MSNHDACPRMSIPRFADSPADVLRRAISRAAEHHGVTVAEIKGRSRLGPVAAAGTAAIRERNPAAKLTTDDVSRIREDNRVHRLIARDYGVSRSQISRIKKGVAW